MAEIGKQNTLKVNREFDFGVYLDGEELGDILLPRRYVPDNYKSGDRIEVFIYFDSEDRIIATTEEPYAMAGEFAMLKVVSINAVGAFLDWGLQKDLLVPFREQKLKMEVGKQYLVFIYIDHASNRIVASTKIDKFLDNIPAEYHESQEVDLIIANKTEIGYKAIINNSHWGIIYKNEVFCRLEKGQRLKGYVKKIRYDEKIDLCIDKPGFKKVDDLSGIIIKALREKGGFIALSDQSPAEHIYNIFGVSKKTFKKAIGVLYKKRVISIGNDGIKLIEESKAL
jgi:predicted RNA-binding protein (virulence factor B family)